MGNNKGELVKGNNNGVTCYISWSMNSQTTRIRYFYHSLYIKMSEIMKILPVLTVENNMAEIERRLAQVVDIYEKDGNW